MVTSTAPTTEIASVADALQRMQRLRASKAVHAVLEDAADVQITQQSTTLLLAVEGDPTAAELGRAANMDAAAVSRELARMEADGLVSRRPNIGRRSGVAVELTSRGQAVRDRIAEVRHAHLARALDGWDADSMATLATLLDRIVDDLQATPMIDADT